MPLDVMNIVASQVILGNATNPPDPETTARVSVAAGLFAGPMGLVLPILAGRQAAEGGGSKKDVIIPDVVGRDVNSAKSELKAISLEVKEQRGFSAEHQKDIVVRQSPFADTLRPLNSTVELTVGDGPKKGDDAGKDEPLTRAEFEAEMRSMKEMLLKALETKTGGSSTSGSSPSASSPPTDASSTSGSSPPASSRATGAGSSTSSTTSSRKE
jgi:beta-lactam-binding protein with PASTA domain